MVEDKKKKVTDDILQIEIISETTKKRIMIDKEIFYLKKMKLREAQQVIHDYKFKLYPELLKETFGDEFNNINFFSPGHQILINAALSSMRATDAMISFIAKRLEKPEEWLDENLSFEDCKAIFKIIIVQHEWQDTFSFLFKEEELTNFLAKKLKIETPKVTSLSKEPVQ